LNTNTAREATVAEKCTFDGCTNDEERSGLCAGHRKQLQRGKQLSPLQPKSRKERLALALDNLETTLQRLADAKGLVMSELEVLGTAYANVDTEDDRSFRSAQREFYAAVDAYACVRARRGR
jgi:hypothetical protein